MFAGQTETVTFLFTDVEGSTGWWQDQPEAMDSAMTRHFELLRDAIEQNGGRVLKTMGDGVFAVFSSAVAGVRAATAAQQRLVAESWGGLDRLLVRMGLHSGEARPRDGDYFGLALSRAARLMAVAHGGQIVMSLATEELVRDNLPDDVNLIDLGEHRLRDLARPERVFQVTAPDLPSAFPPLRSLDAYPTNLPVELSSFVGRRDELAAVAAAASSGRLVTLTGVGGVGKTRLAMHVAGQLLPEFRDGVWLCELAAAARPAEVTEVVLAALRVPPRSGASKSDPLVEFLRTRQVLIVLDNCEHLLEGVGRVIDLVLRSCPDVRVLATSREGLGIDGEQVWPVRSLPLPDDDDDLDAIAASAAVELFVDRAAAVRPDFVLNRSNARAIDRICRRLDGIPLAIELAAARVVAFSPDQIAALLDERFRLLTGGRRTAVERHQTLRATVDWSYELLADDERALFDRLGVFVGGFDAEAATAVVVGDGLTSWDVLDGLSRLVAKSMVAADERPGGGTRYRLLDTLRHYTLERLADSDTVDKWRRRHAQHYAEFARTVGPALSGADERAGRIRLHEEFDNLRVAVTWSLDQDDDQLGVQIIARLMVSAYEGAATGLAAWAQAAVDRARGSPRGIRMAVLCAAAVGVLYTADAPGAHALALEAFGDGIPDDCPRLDACYVTLALTHWSVGQYEQAVDVLAEGRRTLQSRGRNPSALQSALVIILAIGGETARAQEVAREHVRSARVASNRATLADALWHLGQVTWRDDRSGALELIEESIRLTEAGFGGGVYGYALSLRAQLRARAGQPEAALVDLRQAIAFSREKGDWYMVASVVDRALRTLADVGVPDAAALAGAAVADGPFRHLSLVPRDERRERYETLDRVRAALGGERYTEISASAATMSRFDVTDALLNELDRTISTFRPDGRRVVRSPTRPPD